MIILVLVFMILFVALITFMADYLSHIIMVRAEKLPYDWCDFKTFLLEFESKLDKSAEYENKRGSIFIRLWDDKRKKYIHKVYLHASIIRFDDSRCMILYPWSYIKYCKWLKGFGGAKRVKGLYTMK
ncbi:hypothetical protein [Clostridium sp. HBUAS56010]|uniref:hypothetical protein n=1 Tax=Clostridium sp. HBUAS56010 TaxID=2571127 RepID=UPI0011780326|nr:hypothetical protein [Clostridium sp. HBUAS56010]